MIENIRKLRINESCFDNDVLEIFSSEKDRCTLLYGENGSGKSSIARAIKNIADGNKEQYFLDKDDNRIEIADSEQIFVYDEDFIDSNVRIRDDGLNSIVMFDAMEDIQNDIKNVEEENNKLINELVIKEKEYYNRYNDNKSQYQPDTVYKNISSEMKKDDGWADRDRQIKGNIRKSEVKDENVKYIVSLKVKEDQKKLVAEFKEKLDYWNKIRINGNRIMSMIKPINVEFTEEEIRNLLEKKIEKPELTDRDNRLLEVMETFGLNRVNEIRNQMSSAKVKYCPYCLRDLNDDIRAGVEHAFKHIIKEEADKHKEQLGHIMLDDSIMNEFYNYKVLDDVLCNKGRDKLELLMKKYKTINQYIKQKMDNVYAPVIDADLDFEKTVHEINEILLELENKRQKYNKSVEQKDQLKNDLHDLNNKIAYHEIKELYDKYVELSKQKHDLDEKISSIKNKQVELKNEIKSLKAKQKSIKVAVEYINEGLKYVFMSSSRLHIKLDGEKYIVQVNGNNVEPGRLSTGERNAIALCYFFTTILNNKSNEEAYNTPVLVVVDDPISSVDLNNRIGLISYINDRYRKILYGNDQSKMLITTHDMSVFYSLQNSLTYGKNNTTWPMKKLILKNKHIVKDNSNKSIYLQLLEEAYEYAISKEEDIYRSLSIGNILRRILEAFSSFVYKEGIEFIAKKPELLKELKDEKLIKYFNSSMYKLFLHGESHSEKRIKALDDMGFLRNDSYEVKRRIAQDVLLLIYLLNKNHIEAYLVEGNRTSSELESVFNRWKAQIIS